MAFLKKITEYRAALFYTLLINFFVEVEKQEVRETDQAIEIDKVYRLRKDIT